MQQNGSTWLVLSAVRVQVFSRGELPSSTLRLSEKRDSISIQEIEISEWLPDPVHAALPHAVRQAVPDPPLM